MLDVEGEMMQIDTKENGLTVASIDCNDALFDIIFLVLEVVVVLLDTVDSSLLTREMS